MKKCLVEVKCLDMYADVPDTLCVYLSQDTIKAIMSMREMLNNSITAIEYTFPDDSVWCKTDRLVDEIEKSDEEILNNPSDCDVFEVHSEVILITEIGIRFKAIPMWHTEHALLRSNVLMYDMFENLNTHIESRSI